MKNEILISTETTRIEYFYDEYAENKNLAYVFTPSMNRNLEGNHYGGEVFFRNGFDTIAFKINNDDWFQSIPQNLFEKIRGIILQKKYQQKIAYGSSMGGYASIAFSNILDCSTVISISPQYDISDTFDTRWSEFSKKIKFKYQITKAATKIDCNYFIFYDNKDLDELHVQKLLKVMPVNRIKLVKLPFTGHPSVGYLSDVGLIKDILSKIANDNSVDDINFLEKKRLSKSYFYHLSINLLKRNHWKWSLSAIEHAIQLDVNFAEYHLQKSRILDKMGLIEKAIESSKNAVALAPDNLHFLGHLSLLLSKNNLFTEALAALESAIILDKRAAWFYRQKSGVLYKMERLDEAIVSMMEAIRLEPTRNQEDEFRLNNLLKEKARIQLNLRQNEM